MRANMMRDGSIQCTCRSDDAEHELQVLRDPRSPRSLHRTHGTSS